MGPDDELLSCVRVSDICVLFVCYSSVIRLLFAASSVILRFHDRSPNNYGHSSVLGRGGLRPIFLFNLCMYVYMYMYGYMCIYICMLGLKIVSSRSVAPWAGRNSGHFVVYVCMHVYIYMYVYIFLHICMGPKSSTHGALPFGQGEATANYFFYVCMCIYVCISIYIYI